jgi:translation initiation factor 1 (eIF-1/SUI1)
MARDDVTAAWGERMLPLHTLTFPASGDVVLRRGPPPQLRLVVRSLQGGRKHTTHLQGCEAFRLPPELVAREAARLFAAAASTAPAASNPALTEVVLQGDWAEGLAEHVAARYGVPRKHIVVSSS